MVVAAFALSFISTVYTRMFPDDVFPWGSAALPWHLEYIFQAMFFMVLGYVFKEQMEERFDKANTFVFRVILCGSYLLMVYAPNAFGLSLPVMGDIFYTYLCQIVGILLVVAVSKRIRAGAYMKYIGQNTLICFALHGKMYSALQTLLRKTGSMYETILADMWMSTAFSMAFALLISVLLIFPIYVINRYTPFIVGRGRSSKGRDT